MALRRVLHRFLDILLASEAGLVEDVDSEYLHDARVAVRRSRSILAQTKRAFPDAAVRHLRAELAWLGGSTNWLRDLDVFVLDIRERVRAGDALWTELEGLRSHVEQFRQIVREGDGGKPVGRRLDFLLQEFGREANTIGSKGSDAPIAHEIVELKAQIERLREQVQNVE